MYDKNKPTVVNHGIKKDEVMLFKSVFGTEDGKLVLSKLIAMYDKPSYEPFIGGRKNPMDPYEMAWREGRRAVITRIQDIVKEK